MTSTLRGPQVAYIQYGLAFGEGIGKVLVPTFIIINQPTCQARSLGVYPHGLLGHKSEPGEPGGAFLLTGRDCWP